MRNYFAKIFRFFKKLSGMETYIEKERQLNESTQKFTKALSYFFTQIQHRNDDTNKQAVENKYDGATEQTPPNGALFAFKIWGNKIVISQDINPVNEYVILNTHIEKFNRAFINNIEPIEIEPAQIIMKISLNNAILNGASTSSLTDLKIKYLDAIEKYFKDLKPV